MYAHDESVLNKNMQSIGVVIRACLVNACHLSLLVSFVSLCGDSLNHILQLLLAENLESTIARNLDTSALPGVIGRFSADLSKLDIVLVQLLLHDLLQRLERELVCLDKGHLLDGQLAVARSENES